VCRGGGCHSSFAFSTTVRPLFSPPGVPGRAARAGGAGLAGDPLCGGRARGRLHRLRRPGGGWWSRDKVGGSAREGLLHCQAGEKANKYKCLTIGCLPSLLASPVVRISSVSVSSIDRPLPHKLEPFRTIRCHDRRVRFRGTGVPVFPLIPQKPVRFSAPDVPSQPNAFVSSPTSIFFSNSKVELAPWEVGPHLFARLVGLHHNVVLLTQNVLPQPLSSPSCLLGKLSLPCASVWRGGGGWRVEG